VGRVVGIERHALSTTNFRSYSLGKFGGLRLRSTELDGPLQRGFGRQSLRFFRDHPPSHQRLTDPQQA
jgi:hypothetical protein